MTPRHGNDETRITITVIRTNVIDTSSISANIWCYFTLVDVHARSLFGIAFLATAFGNKGFETNIAWFASECSMVIMTV